MNRLSEIKLNYDRYESDYGLNRSDVEWLIEQVEKYQRLRGKILEQTIQNNHEALKRLND